MRQGIKAGCSEYRAALSNEVEEHELQASATQLGHTSGRWPAVAAPARPPTPTHPPGRAVCCVQPVQGPPLECVQLATPHQLVDADAVHLAPRQRKAGQGGAGRVGQTGQGGSAGQKEGQPGRPATRPGHSGMPGASSPVGRCLPCLRAYGAERPRRIVASQLCRATAVPAKSTHNNSP